MAKTLKSVRIEDETIERIEAMNYGGFTESLEKVLVDYFWGEDNRRKEVMEHEKRIQSLRVDAEELTQLMFFTSKMAASFARDFNTKAYEIRDRAKL